jgi:hypothetical protein
VRTSQADWRQIAEPDGGSFKRDRPLLESRISGELGSSRCGQTHLFESWQNILAAVLRPEPMLIKVSHLGTRTK